jgi:dihydrofolate synthase/folylpolyglutamate synthase
LFQQKRTEAVVLEVGLGGRLDATNVVDPDLCVITPVDFDHEALLGKSLEAIAREKAGILKPGVPAVFAAQRPEAQAALDERVAELGVDVVRAHEQWRIENASYTARGSTFLAQASIPVHVDCPLAGTHQAANAIVAIAALNKLGVSAAHIEKGIAATRWPGRLDRVSASPEIILDGAHNPAGARALADYIRQFYEGRDIVIIYGAMRDKAVAEMAGSLFPLAGEVIATAPHQARAVDPETIRALAEHSRVQTAPDLAAALEIARAGSTDRVIFVTGSLFLVGEALALLNG